MAKAASAPIPGALPPLPLRLQVSYGFGAAAFGMGGIAISSTLLTLFFNQVIGLPAIWVGAAIMAAVCIDSVTDPLIGLFSDRLRSPLGRRHTLMYAAALPAALGFYLMWHAPAGLPPVALLAFMIAMLVFVNISFSLFEIPSLALAPELAPDYQQRSSLLAWRWLFFIVGAAGINAVLYQVYLRQDAANPLGVLNKTRWQEFGLTTAIAIFVIILVSTAATHGRIKHLHKVAARRVSMKENLVEIRAGLSHRPLMMIMLGGLFMGFAGGVTFGMAAYFNLHFWGLKPQLLALMSIAGIPASLIGLWAGPWLGGRFGKREAIVGLYFLWLFTAVGPIGLRLLNLMPANGSPLLFPILLANFALSLTLALCCHINIGSCVADSVDDISVKSGRRSEGLMFATFSVLDKCATGGGAFVAGAILSAIAFPTGAAPGTVDPQILREMAYAKLPIVVAFNLISIWFFTRYALTRADHEKNAAILAAARVAPAEPPPGAVPQAAE